MKAAPWVIYQTGDFRVVCKDTYSNDRQLSFAIETRAEDAMGDVVWQWAGAFTKAYDQWDSISGKKTFEPGNASHLLYYLLEGLARETLKVHDGKLLPGYQVQTEER